MKWVREHSLSLALSAVFFVQVGFYLRGAWPAFKQEAKHQAEGAAVGDFLVYAFTEMNLSILADTYGALLLVLFTKWFWERGSAEGKE